MKAWQSICYLVKDSNGNVLLTDGASDSETTTIDEEIIIPKDGVELYIGKYGFVSLDLKDSVYLNFKDDTVPFKSFKSDVRDNFELSFRDVTEIKWINNCYITETGKVIPVESADHGYAKIPVVAGDEIRISGKKGWQASCYLVKDSEGNVLLHDGRPTDASTSISNEEFTIPKNGVELYVSKYGFKYVQIKDHLSVKNTSSPLRDKLIAFNG
ncbi:hypothetical protein QCF18_15040, partial [Staphylococcus aureus]|nr:hypothetical protein [Staphylococcus aureus]